MSNRYKQTYAKLGSERVQEVPKNLSNGKAIGAGKFDMSESDQYWALHKDENWTQIPGIRRWDRKSRKQKFFATVSQILVNLEPATTFNPADVWQAELVRIENEAKQAAEATTTKKVDKVKAADKIVAANKLAISAKKLLAEVTRIRNSKNNLLGIIREIKLPEARGILIIEILKQAYADYKKNGDKKVLYEALWAIQSIELPTRKAPAVEDKKTILVKDPSLVFDSLEDVEKLLSSARKVMAQEKDMIQLQLVEMYDSLPPLSKFTFGFKLDPWQKRVLRWIDAGKSVLICAPTSSGKTVLSSYVAILFKSAAAILNRVNREDGGEGAQTSGGASSGTNKAVVKSSSRAPVDDIMEDNDEEGGGDGGDYDEDDDNQIEENSEDEDDLDEEEEQQQQNAAELERLNLGKKDDVTELLVEEDRKRRAAFNEFRSTEKDTAQRVLFVVPSEPLVWQVAAYFTKLVREEGESETKVCVVTDHFLYYPPRKFDVMPQIVVGTPLALETALTKPRGLVGRQEVNRKAQGDLLPGGFDHFDWVIYDEVHSLDGPEGAALQRLIRSMTCKFLALSATVGNAEQLRGWMERVKGDQIMGLEAITVNPSDIERTTPGVPVPSAAPSAQPPVTKEVTITKTMTLQTTSLTVSSNTTILELKQAIYAQWPSTDPLPQVEHARYPFQLLHKGVDLALDNYTLEQYKVLVPGVEPEGPIVIYVSALVHLLVHQGRFINLQRYVWNDSKGVSNALQTLSPLAAVESVESLRDGVLNNSSLSFTSSDSFRVWEDIKRIFPADSPTVYSLSPYNFFGKTERIELQRTKDYEDLLKQGLAKLAAEFPQETQELLFTSQIHDPPKSFDLCEMILDLKAKDMLPCLPFHLNSFEAIKLYQQLLAGIEYRQKRDHPTYYLNLAAEKEARKKEVDAKKKSTGKNDKELEEAQRAGDIDTTQDFTVDEYAPHPNYIFSKGLPLSEGELTILVDEMERFDAFEKRDAQAMKDFKGKNQAILKHALIRGLRRGIGLFINQISFPSYQRAVQKLASRGKLAVVISDDSLAFGVNMPFRTCIFCGEMFGKLDELMAQQMSGRAGRRGLDTQGNLVYAGVRTSRIRRLMIGTVSNITGRNQAPRYETLILQTVLSPRHVGYQRVVTIGGRSLSEFISGAELKDPNYTLTTSKKAMLDLGILSLNEFGALEPSKQVTYALLSIMWELRDNVAESISLGLMLPDIMEEFADHVKDISMSEKKNVNSEKIEFHVMSFMIIFVLLIDRTPYRGEGYLKLEQLQFFANPVRKDYFDQWAARYAACQKKIPEVYSNLKSAVPPGTELDGTFFQCVLDRNYIHTLSDELKQEMKAKMWHAGNVLRILNNNSWPEEKYYRVSFFIFRKSFLKLKFLNAELIRAIIDFVDVSAQEREKRVDAGAAIEKPAEALPWRDNEEREDSTIFPNSFQFALSRVQVRLKHLAGTINGANNETLKNIYAEVYKCIDAFELLKQSDRPLIQLLVDFNPKDPQLLKNVTTSVASCSFAAQSSAHRIGVLIWFCLRQQPSLAAKFPMFLKTMYDDSLITEDDVRAWYGSSYEAILPTLPSSYNDVNQLVATVDNSVSVAEINKIRSSCDIFIKWLDENEEEEGSDEEDEEEED